MSLLDAISRADLVMVRTLLAAGADADMVGRGGEGTVVHAVGMRHPWDAEAKAVVCELIGTLVEAGADVNHPGRRGGTALTALVSEAPDGWVDVLELLIDAGAKFNGVRNKGFLGGYTPLAIAANRGKRRMLELLLDRGARIDQPCGGGETPLFAAADVIWEDGVLDCFEVLVGRGAKLDHQMRKTKLTALMRLAMPRAAWAIGDRAIRAAQLLLEAGANTELRDARGLTALMLCEARRPSGSGRMVQLLIAHRADVNAVSPKGASVLEIARESSHVSGGDADEALLLAAGATEAPTTAKGPRAFFGAAPDEPLSSAVARRFEIVLDPTVAQYIDAELGLEGLFRVQPFEDTWGSSPTWDRFVGRFGAETAPVLRIGGDGRGTHFWLVLDSGRVLTLHHDATFSEVAATVRGKQPTRWLRGFEAEAAGVSLAELVSLQERTRNSPDAAGIRNAVLEVLGPVDLRRDALEFLRRHHQPV